MNTLNDIFDRLKKSGLLIVFGIFSVYFAINAVKGDRGFFRYLYLKGKVEAAQQEKARYAAIKKDLEHNTLYVSQGECEELFSNGLFAADFNWIPEKPEVKEFDCFAKFRYRQPDQKVKVTVLDGNKIRVDFKEKQRAITEGQFVVLYDENGVCYGGGIIDKKF